MLHAENKRWRDIRNNDGHSDGHVGVTHKVTHTTVRCLAFSVQSLWTGNKMKLNKPGRLNSCQEVKLWENMFSDLLTLARGP